MLEIPLSDYYNFKEYKKLAIEFTKLIKDRSLELVSSNTVNTNNLPQTKVDYIIDEKDFKCPYCASQHFIRSGKSGNKFRYLCKDCKKSYSSTIETTAKYEAIRNIQF